MEVLKKGIEVGKGMRKWCGGAEVKKGLLQTWVDASGGAMDFTSLTLRWILCSHRLRGMELGVSGVNEHGRNVHMPFVSENVE